MVFSARIFGPEFVVLARSECISSEFTPRVHLIRAVANVSSFSSVMLARCRLLTCQACTEFSFLIVSSLSGVKFWAVFNLHGVEFCCGE